MRAAAVQLSVVGLEAGAVVDCLATNFAKCIMKYNPEHVSAIVFLTGNPELAQYIRQATNSRYHTILIVPTVAAAAEPGLTEPAAHVELVRVGTGTG